MKQINLEAILESHLKNRVPDYDIVLSEECRTQVIKALKDCASQVLDIAAEEVELMYLEHENEIPKGYELPFQVTIGDLGSITCIDPDSILKIKERL